MLATRLFLFLALLTMSFNAFAKANDLAIGPRSRMAGSLDIPFNKPVCLNFKTDTEIFELRRKAVMQRPTLINGAYVPDNEIFGAVESGKPWWGYQGKYIYRQGFKSIDGDSEESYFILNPYLLVAAEGPNTSIWNARAATPYLSRADFPYYWPLVSLKFYPKQAKAEAVYDITQFQNQLQKWQSVTLGYGILRHFSLVAYNARDFGFNYIYVSSEGSTNIQNEYDFHSPIQINQMLHCGGSCGYPGGCNNMSPHVPALDHLSFTKLPAKLQIYLWHELPGSPESTPDMTFTIYFK